MRRILSMGLLGTILGVLGCRQPTPDGQWTVAAGSDNGFPMIVRSRASVPSGVVPREYPHLMAITWKYAPETSGMPPKAENQRMEELEALIESGIEASRTAIMTVAVTCNGVREWQLYAKDETAFMEALNKTLAGRPVYPIEIVHQVDPEWAAWKKFTTAMQK